MLHAKFDAIVIAVGAQKPRMIPIPGYERAVAALDFLRESRLDQAKVGKNVVIIGAGNVGCDAAAEAFRLGAESVTLIDIQPPASFGVERRHAEAAGAKFRWPCFTKVITERAVELKDGEALPADTVIMAVGVMTFVKRGQRNFAPAASACFRSTPEEAGGWMSISVTDSAPSLTASAAASQPTFPAPMMTTFFPTFA